MPWDHLHMQRMKPQFSSGPSLLAYVEASARFARPRHACYQDNKSDHLFFKGILSGSGSTGDEMKPSQAIYNFIALPAFFVGSISVSIYLVINLFIKFGWILCLTFIILLSATTLIYCGKSADHWSSSPATFKIAFKNLLDFRDAADTFHHIFSQPSWVFIFP